MSFISNAKRLTFNDGRYTNIQVQNVYYEKPAGRESLSDLRLKGGDDIGIVRKEHLKVTAEIASGPGYFLHAGEIQGRAVIVKVFNSGGDARKRLESTVSFCRSTHVGTPRKCRPRLTSFRHPNVLGIEGISSPTSSIQFITYENAFWKTAEGSLAAALTDDLSRSVNLGFKMIASLSSGMNYLNVQGMPFVGEENLHVLVDLNDRFLICVDPPDGDHTQQASVDEAWDRFNALCGKILKSANGTLYKEGIERRPGRRPSRLSNTRARAVSNPPDSKTTATEVAVPPRREYVWRKVDRGAQSLADIARHINQDLDMKLSVRTVARRDAFSVHRCPGYVREEITLATTTSDSAVVSHDAPSPREVCIVCHQVVSSHERMRCICGDTRFHSRPTVKCRLCGFWSHRDCVAGSVCGRCEYFAKGPASAPSSRPSLLTALIRDRSASDAAQQPILKVSNFSRKSLSPAFHDRQSAAQNSQHELIFGADSFKPRTLAGIGSMESAAFSTTATIGDSLSYQNSAPAKTKLTTEPVDIVNSNGNWESRGKLHRRYGGVWKGLDPSLY
ncbi:hypothetical protein FB45DRAFT_1058215 [Roridomyces roridus]|uniref:Uncharacterized protein n=1 Tax=Roridomyces roridus TaxID=1738132 RepID=A0AAD7BZ93_9AGAR|nr:hypothetical protein FB45DRAFT_1058215 [Roridomyces roridus]